MGLTRFESGGLGIGRGGEGGGGGASIGGNAAAAGTAASPDETNVGVPDAAAHASTRHVCADAVAYTDAAVIRDADHVTFCFATMDILFMAVIWAYAVFAETPSVIHITDVVMFSGVHDGEAAPVVVMQNRLEAS